MKRPKRPWHKRDLINYISSLFSHFKSEKQNKNMAGRYRVKGHYKRVGPFGIVYVRPHSRKRPRR